MKYLLLPIAFFLTSCGIAQVEPSPLVKTLGTVHTIIGEQAILQTPNSQISYTVPTGILELEKEYVFWLDVTGCHSCSNRKAVVVGAVYTTGQVQRDQAAMSKKLSNRRILKQ